MTKEVKLPEVSDNVETGDVVKVLVAVGDEVKIDQPIIELETDKAMFEVPSTEEGVVKEIKVNVGDAISIGSVILTLESGGEEKKESGDKDSKDSKETTASSKEESNDERDKTEEEDKKSDSEKVKTDKQSKPKKSEKEPDKKDPETKSKDSESKDSESKDSESKDSESKESESKDSESKDSDAKDSDAKDSDVKTEKKESVPVKISAAASPSVRRLARELGVDVNSINGSGDGGRISENDIKKYVKAKISGRGDTQSSLSYKSLPDFEKWGEIEKEPMNKVRSLTGEAMTYAWTTIPMVTQFDKADITAIEEFRKKNGKKIESEGGHLTVTSILVKICSAALKAFPQFNSSIDYANKEIIYKKYYNIGIAVDTDRGLLVPVIKNTDDKTLTEISLELTDLSEKARSKKISPDEMDGGNFTISNLGGIGGTNFTPIVYSPQVAILGVSRANKEAVLINENFEPRFMLPLSLTYDHRIIDGADAARFLRWIAEALENPMSMML